MGKWNKNDLFLFFIIVILMILIVLLTHFYGNTDIIEYLDISKYFSGDYAAKIRTTHSYLFGFIHTPIVSIAKNFIIFKITSLIFLFLLVYSVYTISGKNKRALWLMLLSPIVWYIAPWASPIQIASFLFLWAYYFIKRYDETSHPPSLFYSGFLLGLAWAFWDGIIFFWPLLIISFLYNKKFSHIIISIIALLIGLIPRLILDYFLFNSAFFGITRYIFATLSFMFYGGLYNQGRDFGLFLLIQVLFFLPFYSFLLFSKRIFKENKKTIIFLILSFPVLIFNSQIRFALLIVPIIVLILVKYLNKKQYIIQLAIFIILTLLVINPYLIQIKYETNGDDFGNFVKNLFNLKFKGEFNRDLISLDLNNIAKDYPNQIFVVGNTADIYRTLANIYWEDKVKEFVSIEDYSLYLKNDSIISKREFCSNLNIKERRDICISVWIEKNSKDNTDYNSIKYAISEDSSLSLSNFTLIKKYRTLSLFEKN